MTNLVNPSQSTKSLPKIGWDALAYLNKMGWLCQPTLFVGGLMGRFAKKKRQKIKIIEMNLF